MKYQSLFTAEQMKYGRVLSSAGVIVCAVQVSTIKVKILTNLFCCICNVIS